MKKRNCGELTSEPHLTTAAYRGSVMLLSTKVHHDNNNDSSKLMLMPQYVSQLVFYSENERTHG